MGHFSSYLFMVLAMAGLSTAQAGTLYKWVDSQGRVSYHDQPPPEGSGYRVEEKTVRAAARSVSDQDKPESNVPVILYSAPKCASCDLARLYLDKRKVPYAEKNVESDVKLQEELKEKSGSLSVPTIIVGTKVMKGYLESLLEGELDAAGYPKVKESESAKKAEDKDNPSDSGESGYRPARN
ncbi:MAG: glutaredoxin family protein [Sulfuricaulis sp.]|nr:glutaredoxin family protein [Sulfuricaulis sp.]